MCIGWINGHRRDILTSAGQMYTGGINRHRQDSRTIGCHFLSPLCRPAYGWKYFGRPRGWSMSTEPKDGRISAGLTMEVFRQAYRRKYFGRPNDGSSSAGLRYGSISASLEEPPAFMITVRAKTPGESVRHRCEGSSNGPKSDPKQRNCPNGLWTNS